MKRFLIFLLIISGLFIAGCKKSSNTNSGTIYKGVVLHNICCLDVIQTIDADYLGQASWIDSNNTAYPIYTHVFKVSNPCQFGNHAEGDTIRFKVIPQEVQTCACCMVFIFTPNASYPILVVN